MCWEILRARATCEATEKLKVTLRREDESAAVVGLTFFQEPPIPTVETTLTQRQKPSLHPSTKNQAPTPALKTAAPEATGDTPELDLTQAPTPTTKNRPITATQPKL